MTIFDLIRILFFSKKSDDVEADHEALSCFQPFLINRWLSFYSKVQAVFVNETLNKYSSILQDKFDVFQFYLNIIPRQKYSRIQYIKKQKNVKNDEVAHVGVIANNANISQREVNMYIDFFNTQTK